MSKDTEAGWTADEGGIQAAMDAAEAGVYDIAQPQSASLLKDLSTMGKRLAELQKQMEDAEEAAKKAKAEYETLRQVTIPNFMAAAGLAKITLDGGEELSVVTKFACSPNKNAKDQAVMMDFLKKNGGKDMIKSEASVETKDIALLDKAGIPYDLSEQVNTNSLKAWLKEALGYKDGVVATIEEKNVPQCINFYKWKEAAISI